MKIRDEHLYHEAVLNQIAEHPRFTAINTLEDREVCCLTYKELTNLLEERRTARGTGKRPLSTAHHSGLPFIFGNISLTRLSTVLSRSSLSESLLSFLKATIIFFRTSASSKKDCLFSRNMVLPCYEKTTSLSLTTFFLNFIIFSILQLTSSESPSNTLN